MGLLNYTTRANLVANTPENIADVTDCLDKIRTSVNSIDAEQVSTTLAQKLGIDNGSNVGRGKCLIATSESRSSTSYGTLTTPDQVTVALPADGLLFVAYHATWQSSVLNAGAAAVFVGSNQAKRASSGVGAVPTVIETAVGSDAATDCVLGTSATGLVSQTTTSGTPYGGDVSTGQTIGVSTGVLPLFASAGLYNISVQFKASSGSVTVKNRRLWVWSMGF